MIPGVDAPKNGFADIVEPVQLALDQEKRVTEQINALAGLAREHGDFAGEQFMQWFIKEQVEEVSSMSDLLTVVERSRENPMLAEDWLAREKSGGEGADPTAPPPPAAARRPPGPSGTVPSTQRRSPPSTSTFQIGARALIASMMSRAPANASPRCAALAATSTLGSPSGTDSDAVLGRRRAEAVALDRAVDDVAHRLERHLLVGLVLELVDVAGDARERDDGARARIAHALDERVERQRLRPDRDVRAGLQAAAADRRDQRQLVARARARGPAARSRG